MSSPVVSIIIPGYNAEHWMGAAIESALAQTWPAKEIIVVNDGSSDGSLGVAQNYTGRGVRVIDQPNRGASAARNRGLREARGDFIQFLDADDLLAPDKIEKQMAMVGSAPLGTLISGEWGRFTTDFRLAEFRHQEVATARSGVEFLQLHYETGSMMQPGAWLAPRELLDRAGPWDESLSLNDDGEYFARVMLAAGGLACVAGARCYYRSALAGSLSRRTDARALTSLYRSVELTVAHLQTADDSPRTRAACAHAWKRAAYEIYPAEPDLARQAETNCRRLGGSNRPFPGSGRFQFAARFLGWRLARRLFP